MSWLVAFAVVLAVVLVHGLQVPDVKADCRKARVLGDALRNFPKPELCDLLALARHFLDLPATD
jgi:hypothetical protein